MTTTYEDRTNEFDALALACFDTLMSTDQRQLLATREYERWNWAYTTDRTERQVFDGELDGGTSLYHQNPNATMTLTPPTDDTNHHQPGPDDLSDLHDTYLLGEHRRYVANRSKVLPLHEQTANSFHLSFDCGDAMSATCIRSLRVLEKIVLEQSGPAYDL